MKVASRMVQPIAGDTVWYVAIEALKYMSRQLFEDKDLHDLSDLTPQSLSQNQKNHKKTTARLFWTSQIIKMTLVIIYISLLVLFSRLGTSGQSFGGDANKIDP